MYTDVSNTTVNKSIHNFHSYLIIHFFKVALGSSSIIWDWHLDMDLKFYTSVVKGSKLKIRKFWGLIPTFVEVTGENGVTGFGGPEESKHLCRNPLKQL